jgi:UDP-N-acetylglucosamine--N-acetylmuramyl-(pentapeptide) pyrophosphoryl-undecaprenol N-acetylglucosamine transferase
VLFAGTSLGVPSLIQEQNSYAGITNKLLGKRVDKICVAYEGMEHFFPEQKLVLTGNPVRQDIVQAEDKAAEARAFFELQPEKKTILVIGGSLGARTINESTEIHLQRLVDAGYQLIWQTGKPYFAQAQAAAAPFAARGIRVFDFIRRMDLAYAAADVVISRAGALSISELCLVGKPVILVPSPNVAEDHQTKNAMALVKAGAALLVKDADARNQLYDAALALLADAARQRELGQNIRHLARPDAAAAIVDEILKLIP